MDYSLRVGCRAWAGLIEGWRKLIDEIDIQPLVDIDVEDDETPSRQLPQEESEQPVLAETSFTEAKDNMIKPENGRNENQTSESPILEGQTTSQLEKHGSKLATPAVRHIARQLNVQLEDIPGSGKDGRVLKEDVHQFLKTADQTATLTATTPARPGALSLTNALDTANDDLLRATHGDRAHQEERSLPLTNIQAQMFKMMTKSLAIPQFLYTDEYNLDALESLRARLNRNLAQASPSSSLPSSLITGTTRP